MAEHDVEQVWHDFWIPILDEACMEHPEGWGSIELPRAAFEQIKRELYDFRMLAKQLPGFFDEITGGMASKPNTDLSVVARLVDERIHERIKEAIDEEIDIRQIEADEDAWQKGYDSGHSDGWDSGFESGLEEAADRVRGF